MPAPSNSPLAPDTAAGQTALLVIDMVSCWDFPDADKLLPGASRITPRIAALKARCHQAGVPVVYANDNRGRWRSDFRRLVQDTLHCGNPAAAAITQALMPHEGDYFVLKPKQSAFFATPLELLLQHLGARRVIVTGVSSDQCVLTTAIEAAMRDLEVVVPRDCVATQSEQRNNAVLRQLEETHKLPTTPGPRIRLLERSQPRRTGAKKPPTDD